MKTALLLFGVLTAFATVPAWVYSGAMAGVLSLTATSVLLAIFLIVEHMDWGSDGESEVVLEAATASAPTHRH